jgi:hypothetical protein
MRGATNPIDSNPIDTNEIDPATQYPPEQRGVPS